MDILMSDSLKRYQLCKCVCLVTCLAFLFVIFSSKQEAKEYKQLTHYDNTGHATGYSSTVRHTPTTDNPLCPSRRQYPDTDQLAEDILCIPPMNFLHKYKNPCWRSEVTGNLRCIPYFQIIGMDKCGTTDLFDRIVKHPDILGNNGIAYKETWWWSWLRYGHQLLDKREKQYLEDYIRYFDKATKIIERSNDTKGFHPLITGDGTPMDMWDFTDWKQIPQNKGLMEPKYVTPHLIRHINPHTKFIILLRNPTTRLYSDYHFLKLHGNSRITFHQAVVESIEDLKKCINLSSLRHCLFDKTLILKLNRRARIHLGFYSVFLKEWFNVFPRDQFLIIRTEDYANSTKSYLERVFEFLKVRNLSAAKMEKLGMLNKEHKHETKAKEAAGKMLEETQKLLNDLYQPYVKELCQILQDKRFLWDFKV